MIINKFSEEIPWYQMMQKPNPVNAEVSVVVLQVGEVWEEIGRELSLDGVRPVTPDKEALSNIRKIAEDTARRVTAEQNSIMEQQEKEEMSKEELMYTEVLGVYQIRKPQASVS